MHIFKRWIKAKGQAVTKAGDIWALRKYGYNTQSKNRKQHYETHRMTYFKCNTIMKNIDK